MLRLSACLFAILLAMPTASGGETPWVEVAPDTHIRLISADSLSNGIVSAAIEIDMPQTTKTYWRIPGETGIPLVMDAAKSRDIESAEILWPYPTRETVGGFMDFTYHGHTVLPVALKTTGNSPRFEADLLMGVCDEICVPVRVNLALDINTTKPDTAQHLRIMQAMADVPLPWTAEPAPFGPVTYDPITQHLIVPYAAGALDPASIIADTGNPSQLFGAPQKGSQSNAVYFPLLGKAEDLIPNMTPITLTFLTENGVFELKNTLEPAAAAH